MKKVLAALLLTSCVAPDARTDVEGMLYGRISVNNEWLVAVGASELDIRSKLPQGVVVTFPLQVKQGHWLAVELMTGAYYEGSISEPLPAEVTLFTPEEWEQVIVGELAKLP